MARKRADGLPLIRPEKLTVQGRIQEARKSMLAVPLAARDISDTPSVQAFIEHHKTTFHTLKLIRQRDDYKAHVARLTRKQIKILDEDYKDVTIETRNRLRQYSDKAPDILFEIMTNEDEKSPARISAAVELMDRDGRFAKVSRLMSVKQGEDGAPIIPEDAAKEMLAALDHAGIIKPLTTSRGYTAKEDRRDDDDPGQVM